MLTNYNFRHRTFFLALVIFLPFSVVATETPTADPALYLKHVKFLSAPARQGRDSGSEGLQVAANYIENIFRKYGLQTINKEGSFFQTFPVTTSAKMGKSNSFSVVHQNKARSSLQPKVDYIPINFSSSGSATGTLVFAGYGAVAKEFNYNDYQHLDVDGKIVVLIRHEPKHFFSENSGQRVHTNHAHLINKAIEARNRGAKAVLLVNGNLDPNEEDRLLKFGAVSGPNDAGIIMVHVRKNLINQWLKKRGETLDKIQKKITQEHAPYSFNFDKTLQVSVKVDIKREKVNIHNVVGYLPGKSNEYVVLGAHYDHLGLGIQNSLAPRSIGKVHHGADDNASGTSGLLELARLFTLHSGTFDRGVLFIAFSGEEIGLLGSAYWVNNPTLRIEDAIAMINMDMIGRVEDQKIYLGGLGTGVGLKELVDNVSSNYKFKIDFSKSAYSASDHTSFVSKNVPVLFFFSGLHRDYHKPSDTWEKINNTSASKIVDMVGDITKHLLSVKQRPEFINTEQTTHSAHVGGTGSGYGPWFGSVPDFGQVDRGVRFADIQPGSPADKAGVKANDILIQFGRYPVTNLYDFTHALRAHKIGDVVAVKILRNDITTSVEVTLEQRH